MKAALFHRSDSFIYAPDAYRINLPIGGPWSKTGGVSINGGPADLVSSHLQKIRDTFSKDINSKNMDPIGRAAIDVAAVRKELTT